MMNRWRDDGTDDLMENPRRRPTYSVGDMGYTERGLSWDDAVAQAEAWYEEGEFGDEVRAAVSKVGSLDLSEVEEGDVDAAQAVINEWLDRIAGEMGYKPWYGHGTYAVSASSEAGMYLSISEDKDRREENPREFPLQRDINDIIFIDESPMARQIGPAQVTWIMTIQPRGASITVSPRFGVALSGGIVQLSDPPNRDEDNRLIDRQVFAHFERKEYMRARLRRKKPTYISATPIRSSAGRTRAA